ncbi:CLUMA_CG011565, isoform A [Clunio marinus]|uniref:CLUMA_CG011565, isoform A n=1 Tax=Clunio marinus TaxID=568069 RepID=A0A1J1IEK7_9DIPT|nr:CLUMA_CG011565, isoform A [Clunio marinus]
MVNDRQYKRILSFCVYTPRELGSVNESGSSVVHNSKTVKTLPISFGEFSTVENYFKASGTIH